MPSYVYHTVYARSSLGAPISVGGGERWGNVQLQENKQGGRGGRTKPSMKGAVTSLVPFFGS
jgi:hypothetical protein